MRTVIDTNIWFRGTVRANSYPGRIIQALRERRFTLVTSEELILELAEVLNRPRSRSKYGITPEQVEQLVAEIRILGDIVTIPGDLHLCRDPKDDMFLEAALVGKADVLVSQDDDLLSMTVPGLVIVNAYEFVQMLGGLA